LILYKNFIGDVMSLSGGKKFLKGKKTKSRNQKKKEITL